MDVIMKLLGRERSWRLGRKLYMAARGEVPNDIASNGEAALMRAAAAGHARIAPDRPFVAFDIGANLGRWSEFMLDAAAASGLPCSVELFEPVPGAHARLSARLAGRSGVRIHQLAVSDHEGTAMMQVVGEFAGTNSLTASVDPRAEALEVELTTVPAMAARLGIERINLLKIDAEGHDLAILRGARPMLEARAIGVVQFEYNWRWVMSASNMRAVFDLVEGLDYAVARVAPDRLEVYAGWNPELERYFENNYALVRRDLIDPLGARRMRWDASNVLVADTADRAAR